ncbi:MAG TPA: hypothetical protein VL918_05130 [Sphingobium sp.]|nr:hypothetical protein [Sphingobium sp.]
MRRASRLVGGLALAAILATSATPAMAGRGWHGGWHGGHHQHRHHRHDDGFAAFLGLAAVVGAAAVIASSADSKAKTAPQAQAEDVYPQDSYPEDASPPESAEAAGEEDAAVDGCVIAAREEASRDGHYAEVRDITGARPTDDGGWEVDGTVDQRQGYRGESRMRSFSCSWRDGQVADVVLERDDIAGHRPSGSDHSGISS